ncbi:VapE domain-containing protein [Iningainema tapete]|uniref:DUF3854 domain-containing protein n=1 Tax=Iningainema tapete BLCC-T55 TaxID=2748662 RepID=A0A8J6XJ06_9CYAN|nr:VapE domain-containing protein [Iningainema tapete]MBD2773321.1 DUF3854 domain-containing protein [Iningainema tapete BLCC-T55]
MVVAKNSEIKAKNFSGLTPIRNRFESFDEFKSFVRQVFIEGSAIDPELFDACVEFHGDQEFSDGGDVSTPIHDALGWDFKRFGHQASENLYAAFLKNEDGTIWQVIVSLWDDDKQRPYRYMAPKGIGDRAFLPPIPPSIRKRIAEKHGIEVPMSGSFWEWLQEMDIPRIVTEGGKKGLSALSQGYVAIALYGCTCGAKNKDERDRYVDPYLINDLERFAQEDSRWLFAFDRDEKQKAKLAVASGKKKLRLALNAAGCTTVDIKWTSSDGKGLDDFMVNNGSGAFDAAYQKAIAKLEKAFRSDSTPEPKGARSKNKQILNFLESRWRSRLRFNEMTLKPELDGQPVDLDTISMQIARDFDIDISSSKAVEAVLIISKANSYHPVREYLERVAEQYPINDLSIIENIATRYFGTTEPLHNVFMRKHLIGQVRRVFEPGCQHDTVVVLQGLQGVQKSSFWRTLAVNPDWFDDTATSGSNDKDERLKLRRFWILEMAEIESVFRRKEIAGLRGFLTTKCDNLRVPYGRSVESFPRTSCFVASVNPAEFLVDPEGHRRFWVIPVLVDRIPVQMLKDELDQLWAAAVHAYRSGDQHWLTPEEEKRNALLNKRFEVEDSWTEVIELYLENLQQTTVTEILTHCLKIEIGRHDRQSQMRVAECLKRLGWVKGEKKKINGKSTPVWRCQPDFSGCQPDILEVSTKVSTNSNPDAVDFSDNRLTPFNENTPNFEQQQNINVDPPSTNQNLKTGVNPQGVNQTETTQNQGFGTIDTSKAAVDTSNKDAIAVGAASPIGEGTGTNAIATSTTPTAKSQQWTPIVGQSAIYGNEAVEVVGFWNRGAEFQIEFKSGTRKYVKRGSLRPVAG